MIEKIFLKTKNFFHGINIKLRNRWQKHHYTLPKNVGYFQGSLFDAVFESAVKYPYNIAIEYENKQITYKQFISKINKCARALKAVGVQKGDKVTICMPNTPEEVIMFYAINEVGAVANMIHPLSSEKEIEYYLNKANSKVMLCIDVAYLKIRNIIDNTKLEKVIVVDATKSMEKIVSLFYWITKGRKNKVKESECFMKWDHFIKKSSSYNKDPYVEVDPKDPAVILYSGGTTGKSKGVIISNYSFNAQALQSKYVVPDALIPENSFLTFLPNFHAFGIGICTHTPLYNGMKIILIPQFDSKKFKKYLRRYRFNILCGVPTLYDYISKMKFRKDELKCLKLVVCGGDSLSLALKQRVNAFLNDYGSEADIRVGYGLTESSGVIALSPSGIFDKSDIIGYPFPNTIFKIFDPTTGKECKKNEDGEICVAGPNLMVEYLEDPVETKNTIIKKGGIEYLKTGDIGFIDDEGLLHYKSRLKRMIITSGYNVYPSNVEDILMMHESVENAAVIGVPDDNKGEIVKAFVVLSKDKDNILTKNSIKNHLKKHLARYEQPREIRYIDKLPITKMGKIDYKELEKMD